MSRQKKLDKMEVIELAKEKPKPEFNFMEARAAGKMIFEAKELVIGYDEPLTRPFDISMERGEKVVLKGSNGIGKTTLLKSILGLIPALSGSVELGDYLYLGYFEQEMAPGNATTCIEESYLCQGRTYLILGVGISVLHPVSGTFCPGKMRPDDQTHREPGTCPVRR